MMELVLDPEMEPNVEANQRPIDSFDSPLSVPRHRCSACGWDGDAASKLPKRRSPPSRRPEPKTKKPVLDHVESLSSRGYSKISLPFPFGAPSTAAGKPAQNHTLPPLRRTVSDPCEAIAIVNAGTPSISPLPPPPTALRRTVSNPNPSPAEPDIATESMKEECPESKKLKRMIERLGEMNQWWNAVMQEQEQEDRAKENESSVEDNSGNKKEGCDAEIEETVEVERVEESIIIRFNCPCRKSYEILLSGENCFYKLA